MSFRNISKCCFYDSFCCVFFLCHCLFVFSWCDDTWSTLFQWMQNSQSGVLSLRKHFPWFHGVTHSRLSHGYFYINLPPIFMCLLPVVLMYLSKTTTKTMLFYFLLFSLTKNTWPHRASPALPTCCCWRENYCFMWDYSKVTNCSLVCMYTFVIEMYCKLKKKRWYI